jgi:small subunit ribosomal protein S15
MPALKGTSKKNLIKKHRTHDKDTGSPHVQIAILTKEIAMLTKHLQEHAKDFSARRGLLGKVARRRTLLTYLKMNSPDQYQQALEANKLKK